MLLDVAKALQAPGGECAFACDEEAPPTTWGGAELCFVSPVKVCGSFVAVKDNVWVRAEVSARMRLPCANCLADAYHDGVASMDVCFSNDPDPDDPDLYALEGHTLRLDDAALGALWLAMPMRVLCRPDCRGLCPVCGANRNVDKCACQLPAEHPFSALALLFNQDELNQDEEV